MANPIPSPTDLWRILEDIDPLEDDIDVDDYENIHTVVYRLPEPDGRFIQFTYTADGQGNYNSWRDGELDDRDIVEVEPYVVTKTAYRVKASS